MISLHNASRRFRFRASAVGAAAALLSAVVLSFGGCCKLCGSDCEPPAASASTLVTPVTPITLVTPVTLHLDVQGMHCNGCVQAITADVREIDGVTDVQISLEKNSAQITLSKEDSAAKVESSIRALGYTVTVVPTPN